MSPVKIPIVFVVMFFIILPIQKTFLEDNWVFVKGDEEQSGFYINRYEVTLEEFHQFTLATGHVTQVEKEGIGLTVKGRVEKKKGVNWRHDVHGELVPKSLYKSHPVTRLSVSDISAYCKWRGVVIPSLKQWLYAANSGDSKMQTRFSGSNNIKQVAWFDGNSGEIAREVGVKKPNLLGIHDMSGNMAELVWTMSDKDTVYQYVGGSFFHGRDEASLTTANVADGLRLTEDRFTRSWVMPFLGFRCIKRADK